MLFSILLSRSLQTKSRRSKLLQKGKAPRNHKLDHRPALIKCQDGRA